MTNRMCGTCRFFEVSTLQTSGWCRNPANPRRDPVALLRNTELGCRSGWGKDTWEAGAADTLAARMLSAEVPTDDVAPTPVGGGIAPLIPAEFTRQTGSRPVTSELPPAQDPAAAAPGASEARRPGPEDQAAGQGRRPGQGPGQDVVVGFGPQLNGHPELGDNGVPLPRARRSAVAEAHKRMLERRKAERALAEERRAAPSSQPPA
ncbi:MAG: hypothetical protein M3Q65_00675, partial [Chloroflexota bacterium]|nr:hypothetical protein [Chloroflexota bacterium]